MSRVHCPQPSRCGVRFHVAGTQAASLCGRPVGPVSPLKSVAPRPTTGARQNPYEGSTDEVLLRDTTGEMMGVFPGEISGSVRHIYRNGQCLALAAAISRKTGWPVVTREVELNPQKGNEFILVHAYALNPDDHILVDIDGGMDWEGSRVKSWREEDIVTVVEADEVEYLMAAYESSLEPQDIDLAETFMDYAFELYEQDFGQRA